MSDGVQPGAPAADGGDPGQGPEGASGLYDLSSIPPELLPHVEPHLKQMEGNVTKKFQEHADYRKQWEPFEQLGLADRDPEQVQQLLELAEVFEDPEMLKDWWTQVGEEMGFDLPGESEEGELGEEGEELTLDTVQQAIAQQLDQRLGPVLQEQQLQAQQRQVEQAEAQIEGTINSLREEHGDFDVDTVLKLSLSYTGDDNVDDPIAAGFRDYQELISKAEQGLLGKKLAHPEAPEGAGVAATAEEPVTDFDKAKTLARERLRQSRVA